MLLSIAIERKAAKAMFGKANMKAKGVLTLFILGLGVYRGNAQGGIHAFVNYTFWAGGNFQSGDNLFCNPLLSANNSLNAIIPHASEGTIVFLWDSSPDAFTQSSTFVGGMWSLNLELPPGEGALLRTFTTFTNTFSGVVLAPDGSILNPDAPVPHPPQFDGPSGRYLLADKFPATLPPFDYILGRGPKDGEQFTRLDPLTQTYHTTTFASGAWNNGTPFLQIGEAAFFDIVPEPSSASLALVCFLAGWFAITPRSNHAPRCPESQ